MKRIYILLHEIYERALDWLAEKAIVFLDGQKHAHA